MKMLPAIMLFIGIACLPAAAVRAANAAPPPPPVISEDYDDLVPPPPPTGDNGNVRQRPPFSPRLFDYLRNLKTSNPDEYRRLKELRRNAPEQFHREINKLVREQQQNSLHAKMRKYDNECWEIARELRCTADPERAAQLRSQLDEKLKESFETLLEHTRQRMENLQKHMDTIQRERDNILNDRRNFFLNAPLPPPCPPEKSQHKK